MVLEAKIFSECPLTLEFENYNPFVGALKGRLSTAATANTVVLTFRGLTCVASFAGQIWVFETTIASECL